MPAHPSTPTIRLHAAAVTLPPLDAAWLPPRPVDPRGRPVSWLVVCWVGPLHYYDLALDDWAVMDVDRAWMDRQVALYRQFLAECPAPNPLLRQHRRDGKRGGDLLEYRVALDPSPPHAPGTPLDALLVAAAWADPAAPDEVRRGEIHDVSMGIGSFRSSLSGTDYEDVIVEVSLVSSGQVRGARVLNNRTGEAMADAPVPAAAPAPMPPAPPAPIDPVALREALKPLLAEMLPAMLREAMAPATPMPAEPAQESSEMAALKREVERLKAESLAAHKAAFAQAYPKGGPLDLTDAERAELEALYLNDPKRFEVLDGALERLKGRLATPAAPAAPPLHLFARRAGTTAPPAPVDRITITELNRQCLAEAKGDVAAAKALRQKKISDGLAVDYSA